MAQLQLVLQAASLDSREYLLDTTTYPLLIFATENAYWPNNFSTGTHSKMGDIVFSIPPDIALCVVVSTSPVTVHTETANVCCTTFGLAKGIFVQKTWEAPSRQ